MAETQDDEFKTALTTDDGTHLDAEHELPINHRLRAEALVAKKLKSDPGGVITDELIEDTRLRLIEDVRAEKAAAATAKSENGASAASPITAQES